MVAPSVTAKVRKGLSTDALYRLVGRGFSSIPDHRQRMPTFSLHDALMSGFAMFSLKDPSLLAFSYRRNDANMKQLFGIGQIPSDTQMREILDPVQPELLRPVFNDVLRELQRGKGLEPFAFHEGHYLLSVDGTGYFSSKKIHCASCLQKVNKKTGEITYQHQMLGAAIVHPDQKAVIPLAPEPIQKLDGETKNDCERNASKRLLTQIRREHPKMKFIVLEDGLASNGPHIRLLNELSMSFILGAKPGDHPYLYEKICSGFEENRVTSFKWMNGNVECHISFLNDVPLNEANQDLLVNFLMYSEYGPDGKTLKEFAWVTDQPITRANAATFVHAGRSRWKIENETFNTLKNQDYHFEHNYGHGNENLSVVFALLMMLAFLVDQVQQLCCPLFSQVWRKLRTKRGLWDNLRSHFRHFKFQSMRELYEAILYDRGKEVPLPPYDTS